MTRVEMLAELRRVINDVNANNTSWQDATLLLYLMEGQDVFCERTGFFIDASSFTITLAEDTDTYDIPDRIIEIFEVWDDTRLVEKMLTGANLNGFSAEGTPELWQTEYETGKIKLYPTPTADQNGDSYSLRAWRYSLEALNATSAEPEIPSQFHMAPVEWAAYKAFGHHDVETQDPVKAKDHLDNFKMYVSMGKAAMRRYHNQYTRVGTDSSYVV